MKTAQEIEKLREKRRERKIEIAKEIAEQVAPRLEALKEEYRKLELEGSEEWIVRTIEEGMEEDVKKSATVGYTNEIEKWKKLELSKFVDKMRYITSDNQCVDWV